MPMHDERSVLEMADIQSRIMAYQTAMALVRSMFDRGLISEAEYFKIDTIMTKKHGLSSDSIYRKLPTNLLDNHPI